MNFSTANQEKIYRKVGKILTELFPETFSPWGQSSYMGVHGSTIVFVGVIPYGEEETVVRIISYVVSGARVDPDLMAYLLRTNANLRFGAFGIDDDGDIFLHHTIRGNDANPNSLAHYVAEIASKSDEYDDQIVAQFGGMTALEKLKKTLESEAKRQPIEWS
jgi:hypothetical protein